MLRLKDTAWLNGEENKTHTYAACKGFVRSKDTNSDSKVMRRHTSCKWKQRQAGVAVLISDKLDFKTKAITSDREGHCKYNNQDMEVTEVSIGR